MADDFEARLYALIEKSTSRSAFELFVAKGENARLFEDLKGEAAEDLLHDVIELLKACGLSEPPRPKHNSLNWLWPDYLIVFRDFTVGELKIMVENGAWPDDAATWSRVDLLPFMGMLALPLLVAFAVVVALLYRFGLVRS